MARWMAWGRRLAWARTDLWPSPAAPAGVLRTTGLLCASATSRVLRAAAGRLRTCTGVWGTQPVVGRQYSAALIVAGGELPTSAFVSLSFPASTVSQVIRMHMIKTLAIATALAASLSACSNPYDPGQRALGGAGLGAAGGAAIGGLAGGGRGALAGALLGGALGAVGGAATTPNAPPPPTYYEAPPPPPSSGPYRY